MVEQFMNVQVLAASAVAAVIGFLFIVVAAFSGVSNSSGEQFFNCQCDSAIGPDPSATTTTTAGSTPCDSDEEWEPSDVPSTNPLVSMTVAPGETEISDYHRTCMSAIASGAPPLQTPALRNANTGFAVDCARELAYAQVGNRTRGSDAAQGEVIRDLVYAASVAVPTGRCIAPADGTVSGSTGSASPSVQSGYTTPTGSCAQTADQQTAVYLPNTVAGQALCGQRVRLGAVSPGDLVFWDYRDNAPTRAGIAVEHTRVTATDSDTGEFVAGVMRVVAVDPATGEFTLLDVPSDSDARAKRVLAGAAN
ncbi:NlpC/P60 family protein [Nocardia cyriacigeorgica]|uniref:hypothetical protein n=1 Tax=Nocardia cyriacigeorgica TaxID=135487 RepID=UPI00189624B7|nr:hypothetical protein [Nocardia cyriacigeorgica]MBF6415260.1 hypothetical protein [Nocardia cyriacigeorgica]